jgi:hypothetical protein
MTLLDADEKKELNTVGEDTWELFEAIEESFGVDLGDYHALAGITVGELAENICRLANYPAEERCLSAVAFYRLRRAFETLFSVPRTAILPTTSVVQLLPWKSRRTQWRLLQEHLGLTVPGLMYPGWLLLLCLVTPAALLISAREFLGFRLSAIEIIGGSLALIIPAVVAFIPFARTPPPSCATMGGLAKVVLARNYAVFATQHGSSSERGVLPAVRQLIATETGSQLGEVSPETRIPADLNIC